MRLEVFVQGERAGLLDQPSPSQYRFVYAQEARTPVSLAMPVRREPYLSPYLHPVFQVSLPEGALRTEIERGLSKRVDAAGDLAVLALVGRHLVGNLVLLPEGASFSARQENESENLSRLLRYGGSPEFIAGLLERRSGTSGVSGGYLKVLADTAPVRISVALDRWIVKLPSPLHPFLARNEFFSMLAAARSGAETASVRLSDDGNALLVARFDRTDTGAALGFEDLAALMGLPAGLKFSGSVERIVKTLRVYCAPDQRARSLRRFFRQYLLAMALRNGDAHLKNFALIHEGGTHARLAPCYDMATMAAYAPAGSDGHTLDIAALTLGGTKRWPSRRALAHLARDCGADFEEECACVARGVNDAAGLLLRESEEHPEFSGHGARMLGLWREGLSSLGQEAVWEVPAADHDGPSSVPGSR